MTAIIIILSSIKLIADTSTEKSNTYGSVKFTLLELPLSNLYNEGSVSFIRSVLAELFTFHFFADVSIFMLTSAKISAIVCGARTLDLLIVEGSLTPQIKANRKYYTKNANDTSYALPRL